MGLTIVIIWTNYSYYQRKTGLTLVLYQRKTGLNSKFSHQRKAGLYPLSKIHICERKYFGI